MGMKSLINLRNKLVKEQKQTTSDLLKKSLKLEFVGTQLKSVIDSKISADSEFLEYLIQTNGFFTRNQLLFNFSPLAEDGWLMERYAIVWEMDSNSFNFVDNESLKAGATTFNIVNMEESEPTETGLKYQRILVKLSEVLLS